MNFVKTDNDKKVVTYPYLLADLISDNPNTSFPCNITEELAAQWNVFPVIEEEKPVYHERIQKCVRNSEPTFDGSHWRVDWTVSSKTEEETTQYDADKSAEIRTDRNKRLADTDWWAVSDRTMSSGQTEYRDLLRKVPQQTGFPLSVTWQTKPS